MNALNRLVLLACISLFTAFVLNQNVYADISAGPSIFVLSAGVVLAFGIGIALIIVISLLIIKQVKKKNVDK